MNNLSEPIDTVLRGGTLVDGTGRPRRRADVALSQGRVAGIGTRLRGQGREVDASGMIVAPGFVDIHTHYDAQVFWDPALTPSSFHGVTSVIAGNCGFSIAPTRPEGVETIARTLQHVEDMNFDTLASGVPWGEFQTFPQYLDAVERRGVLLNFGCYVGHTAIRLYVMGDDAYERPATAGELDQMQSEVREAMASGAIGFASSTASTHNGDGGRPVPSRVADLDELRHLLAPLGDIGRGVISLLPGNVIPHDELFRIQAEIGRPMTWTALVSVKGSSAHQRIIESHHQAQVHGIDVRPQVSCRPIIFQITMGEPFTFNVLPTFSELMAGGLEARMSAYRSREWRDRAWKDLTESSRHFVQWETLLVAESDIHPELVGRRIVDIADARGITPLDAILDISLDERLGTRFWSQVANNDPDVVSWLLGQEGILLGLADSGAHVSQLCDACFATDFLGSWVRDKELMPLERAIQMLSSEPADFFGLVNRGTIEVGMAADVVVFDPDTVSPGPLRRIRDFPAQGERLTAENPVGVQHVFVNGQPIREDGDSISYQSDWQPGSVLRS